MQPNMPSSNRYFPNSSAAEHNTAAEVAAGSNLPGVDPADSSHLVEDLVEDLVGGRHRNPAVGNEVAEGERNLYPPGHCFLEQIAACHSSWVADRWEDCN